MKHIFALSFITAGFFLNAQNIGNSPYAAYGIGDVKYDNTVENSAMAGLSTAYITDFNSSFNFRNPAANENLQLTTIKVEATNENNFFKSDYNNYKVTKHSTYLSNLSIAFPITEKMKFGLGYQPYSSKSYNILVTETLGDGSVRANTFRGEGSLNTVQGALSYQVTPEFGLGLRTNFYFGNLYDIDELAYSNAELINGYETRNRVNNFNFTVGTTYQKKYENDRKLTLGATTTFGNSSKMESYYTNSTYFYNSAGVKNYISVVEERNSTANNLLPLEASVGAGFGHNLRWFVGSQVDYRKGETIQFVGQDFEYKDSYRISAGGWILPNANNFRNYFERIIYRYGAFYEKGNLNINNTDINKFGITFGATLPFKNTSLNRMTGLDVGVELGKRGTLQNNLVNQNFINLKVGFNFADRWFQKRLYN
ncbi:MAG: outer membrane protein transport protein [Weeksellaceae bacterium]|nr:outer membrane protein transport protein [Weeksellaceae bacterium]